MSWMTLSLAERMLDASMDLCVLAAAQLVFGCFRPGRLLLAQLLLAACSLLISALGRPGVAAQLLVYLACAAVLTGERRFRRILEAAFCIACAFAAAAGLAAAGRQNLHLAPMGALLLLFLARRRRNARCRWNIELHVERDGLCERFPALIDTGNRLRERRSGLPVLIVEAQAIPRLAAHAAALPPAQKRTLPFGVLGGAGEMECFRPDRVELRAPGAPPGDAPECWLAVFPGKIPGPTRALAPPEFAEALPPAPLPPFRAIQDTARRFRYGVFKRSAVHLWDGGSVSERFGMLHRRQRPASPAADPGGGAQPRAQGERRGQPGPRHHDRAQPPAGGLHRPEV